MFDSKSSFKNLVTSCWQSISGNSSSNCILGTLSISQSIRGQWGNHRHWDFKVYEGTYLFLSLVRCSIWSCSSAMVAWCLFLSVSDSISRAICDASRSFLILVISNSLLLLISTCQNDETRNNEQLWRIEIFEYLPGIEKLPIILIFYWVEFW